MVFPRTTVEFRYLSTNQQTKDIMAKSKLSKGQQNFVRDFLGIDPDDEKNNKPVTTYINRFTGETVLVSILVYKALEFVFKTEAAMYQGASALANVHPKLKPTNAVQKFDMARYTVLAADSEVYMKVLD